MKKSNYTTEIQALEARWKIDLNEGLLLVDASLDSKCTYVWKCEKYGLLYQRGIRSEVKSQCPYCSGKYAVPGLTDLYTLHSFVAEQWDWSKNQDNPRTIHPGSKKIYSWICPEGHRREKAPYHELRTPGTCGQCKKMPNLVAKIRPDLEPLWSTENLDDFHRHSIHSHYKAIWCCPHGHSYERMVFHQVAKIDNYCPHCRHPIKDQGISVASTPQLMRIWNDSIDPTTVSRQSHLKAKWKCVNEHEFTKPVKEVFELRGTACKKCLGPQESYWELSVKEWLDKEQVEYISNHRILQGREIDAFIPSLSKGIEVNGEWFHSTEMIVRKYSALFSSGKKYHEEKMKIAEIKGIDLAFVWAHDLSKHYDEIMGELYKWLHGNKSAREYSMLNRFDSIFDDACPLCGALRRVGNRLPGVSLIE